VLGLGVAALGYVARGGTDHRGNPNVAAGDSPLRTWIISRAMERDKPPATTKAPKCPDLVR
jgi:hypothetical protein